MSIEEIQQKIGECRAQLASLEQELRDARKAQAESCKCGRLLWNDRGYAQFVAIQTTDGTCHKFCDKCASEFVRQNGYASKGGTVAGAWDVPDPMGM